MELKEIEVDTRGNGGGVTIHLGREAGDNVDRIAQTVQEILHELQGSDAGRNTVIQVDGHLLRGASMLETEPGVLRVEEVRGYTHPREDGLRVEFFRHQARGTTFDVKVVELATKVESGSSVRLTYENEVLIHGRYTLKHVGYRVERTRARDVATLVLQHDYLAPK